MNSISFYGGETSGSVGKRNLNNYGVRTLRYENPNLENTSSDTVNFRGGYKENESSALSAILIGAGALAMIVGGLGYAHKNNLVGKLKDGKIKNILAHTDVVTKPCHDACSMVKNGTVKMYKKIMEMFRK